MTATAYPATMATDPYLRGGNSHTNFWSNFNGSAHLSNRLGAAGMDSGFHSSASASPLPGRPRSGGHDQSYSYGRDEPSPYDRHAQSSLHVSSQAQHTTYPSLKRPYSQTNEPAAYQELVQDLRDDGSRMTMNQDHKLLSFRRAQDKYTIVDQHGRMQQIELSAQLHGMFFLSEMPSTASDGSTLQPELTCYRRNLFQISGSLVTPRGQLSVVMNESNESVPVTSMEVAVSAIESVDGNPVRLIVIPWKTPPANAPEISQGPDQEPSALPLIPFQGDGAEPDGEYAVYPIGWRRLQFRIATANNGRRKELQQHFVLHLKVYGTLADNSKVVLSETATAPIVVRGRSPRNFQARKEIPLLGSSAGSRGQALVENGIGVVAGALCAKPQELKRGMDIQAPRSSFTFTPPKIPSGPHLSSMRSSTYPTWSSHSGTTPLSQLPSSGPGYSSAPMGADSYPKVPLSSVSSFTAEPQELPIQSSIPSMTLSMGTNDQNSSARGSNPYSTYVQPTSGSQLHVHPNTPSLSSHDSVLNVPRYVDQDRPSKSARQANQQSVHSNGSSSPSEYRYGGPSTSSTVASSREYYPPPSSAWTSTTTTAATEASSSVAYAQNDGRSYPFPQESYKVGSSTPVASQKMESRTFDSMNNYSWNAS